MSFSLFTLLKRLNIRGKDHRLLCQINKNQSVVVSKCVKCSKVTNPAALQRIIFQDRIAFKGSEDMVVNMVLCRRYCSLPLLVNSSVNLISKSDFSCNV